MAQVPGSCDLSTKDGQKPIVYWYQYSQQYIQALSTSSKINKFSYYMKTSSITCYIWNLKN